MSSPLKFSVWYLAANAPNPNRPSSAPGASCAPAAPVPPAIHASRHTRFRPAHSLFQHLPSRPVGFQKLSRLFHRLLVLPQSIGHFHHFLDQHCNLLFHNSELTPQTQTNQVNTARSSVCFSSVLPNSSSHYEFSLPVSLEIHQLCPFNSPHAPPCSSNHAYATVRNEYDSGHFLISKMKKGCNSEDECRWANELLHKLTENK